jgi:hypothetical protein
MTASRRSLLVEQGFQRLWRLHRDGLALSDLSANEIWQATVGEGNVRTAFNQRDRRSFRQAPAATPPTMTKRRFVGSIGGGSFAKTVTERDQKQVGLA